MHHSQHGSVTAVRLATGQQKVKPQTAIKARLNSEEVEHLAEHSWISIAKAPSSRLKLNDSHTFKSLV